MKCKLSEIREIFDNYEKINKEDPKKKVTKSEEKKPNLEEDLVINLPIINYTRNNYKTKHRLITKLKLINVQCKY